MTCFIHYLHPYIICSLTEVEFGTVWSRAQWAQRARASAGAGGGGARISARVFALSLTASQRGGGARRHLLLLLRNRGKTRRRCLAAHPYLSERNARFKTSSRVSWRSITSHGFTLLLFDRLLFWQLFCLFVFYCLNSLRQWVRVDVLMLELL